MTSLMQEADEEDFDGEDADEEVNEDFLFLPIICFPCGDSYELGFV